MIRQSSYYLQFIFFLIIYILRIKLSFYKDFRDGDLLSLIAPPGFEPGSSGPEPEILDH